MQKSSKLLIKMERSYVNTTDLENELEKYDSLQTNIVSYSVSWCLKWSGTYVFLSQYGEKEFYFKAENKCLIANWLFVSPAERVF